MLSKFFLLESLLHKLETAMIVIAEVMSLIFSEYPFHDFEQLFLAGVVDLLQLALDLVEPVLNGVQLRRVRGQIQHIDAVLLGQVDGLLLIVDGAVVHHDPLLLRVVLLLLLVDLLEELPDEVKVLEFAVVALDETPVGQSIVANDGDQRKTFALGDGAVYCDFFVGSRPSLIASHVQIEP